MNRRYIAKIHFKAAIENLVYGVRHRNWIHIRLCGRFARWGFDWLMPIRLINQVKVASAMLQVLFANKKHPGRVGKDHRDMGA